MRLRRGLISPREEFHGFPTCGTTSGAWSTSRRLGCRSPNAACSRSEPGSAIIPSPFSTAAVASSPRMGVPRTSRSYANDFRGSQSTFLTSTIPTRRSHMAPRSSTATESSPRPSGRGSRLPRRAVWQPAAARDRCLLRRRSVRQHRRGAGLSPVAGGVGSRLSADAALGCSPSFAVTSPTSTCRGLNPWHPEFPLNWSAGPPPEGELSRAVFIASREVLAHPNLTETLPVRQRRH